MNYYTGREGFDRNTDKEFQYFLFISRGSTSEVQSLVYVALDQKYMEPHAFTDVVPFIPPPAGVLATSRQEIHSSMSSQTWCSVSGINNQQFKEIYTLAGEVKKLVGGLINSLS